MLKVNVHPWLVADMQTDMQTIAARADLGRRARAQPGH
jgi:hypothetical protein